MDMTKHPRNHLSSRAKKVHGEMYVTNGATTEVALYDTEGSAVTISATDRLYITHAHLASDTAGTLALFVGADSTVAAGEYVLRTRLAANGNVDIVLPDVWIGQTGAKPYVSTSGGGSAIVAAQITGYVMPTA